MVSDSRLNSPDYWPGSMCYILGQDTYFHSASLHPGEQMCTGGADKMLGVKPGMESIPSRLSSNTSSVFVLRKLG